MFLNTIFVKIIESKYIYCYSLCQFFVYIETETAIMLIIYLIIIIILIEILLILIYLMSINFLISYYYKKLIFIYYILYN